MEEMDLKIYIDSLAVSRELLEVAETQDFDGFDELLEQRNKLLKLIYAEFDELQKKGVPAAKFKILKELFEINKKIMQLASKRKQEIADQIRKIRNAERIKKTYYG